jgi:hypothetical protein
MDILSQMVCMIYSIVCTGIQKNGFIFSIKQNRRDTERILSMPRMR